MAAREAKTDAEHAEEHAQLAERLLKSRYIWSYVQAEAHASLALYYATRSKS